MNIETKTIKSSTKIIEKLSQDILDKNVLSEEYIKLFKAYKRLSKRYEKTNKMSDIQQQKTFTQNKSLSIDKVNIQKIAKNKIMDNIKIHRETKEDYLEEIHKQKKMIKQLEEKLQKLSKGYSASLKKISLLENNKLEADNPIDMFLHSQE